jgi:hypothetical protein
MKEYEDYPNKSRVRFRNEKIMSGSTRGAEINGYFVHEIVQTGSKTHLKPTKFMLEWINEKKTYPEIILNKKNPFANFFVKTAEEIKVPLPPHLDKIFEATSKQKNKAEKAIKEITNLLTADVKDICIEMKEHKIKVSTQRSKITSEKLFLMKNIGRKLLETGEENEI